MDAKSSDHNLSILLRQYAETQPEEPLLYYNELEIPASTVWQDACRLSRGLQQNGVLFGSRVLLMLPNSPEYLTAYYAILIAGAIVVPVNVMLRERELHYMMEDSEACAIIAQESSVQDVINAASSLVTMRTLILCSPQERPNTIRLRGLIEWSEPAAGPAEVSPDDTAVIMYTAGMTGHPKGAELTHRSLLGNARNGIDIMRVRSKDRILGVLPFYHAYGQTAVMNLSVAAGAGIVLLSDFDPVQVMDAVEKYQITIFMVTPSMYRMILLETEGRAYDFSSVRYCVSGGSALKPELLEAFEKRFNASIYEGYGLSETSAIATFNQLNHDRRPGSIGTPIDCVEVKLVDDLGEEVNPGEVGEITIKSIFMMKGYLHRPEATKAVLKNGWFYTGDLARQDEDGYLYIIDRKTDMIVKGGFNVYPVEIEELLMSHPDIAEAAVIGIPDDIQGEEIKACIVLREGSQISANQLSDYCRQYMSRYKCPRYIQFYQQLPRNPQGRVWKQKLRSLSS
ncbi:long-chain fatty acid--CoA ligase [bacterium]|nr:long-chain fatty acid--CoA ligase [bacterium]MBU1881297.1 long-chain fatty acid--CoA ligase [bacterium]